MEHTLENTIHEPKKKFMLISQLPDGHEMVTWHETKEDLTLCAKDSRTGTPIDALEICSCREINLESI